MMDESPLTTVPQPSTSSNTQTGSPKITPNKNADEKGPRIFTFRCISRDKSSKSELRSFPYQTILKNTPTSKRDYIQSILNRIKDGVCFKSIAPGNDCIVYFSKDTLQRLSDNADSCWTFKTFVIKGLHYEGRLDAIKATHHIGSAH